MNIAPIWLEKPPSKYFGFFYKEYSMVRFPENHDRWYYTAEDFLQPFIPIKDYIKSKL